MVVFARKIREAVTVTQHSALFFLQARKNFLEPITPNFISVNDIAAAFLKAISNLNVSYPMQADSIYRMQKTPLCGFYKKISREGLPFYYLDFNS